VARIVIYTRDYCGYCTRAVRLLDAKKLEYEKIDATGNEEMRAMLRQKTRQSTVPQIFIDGKSIGGCDDLYELDDRGELDRMLQRSSSDASG
jgi:glutaredoxin 3